jgi:two-component system sensor histidine kinase VicK
LDKAKTQVKKMTTMINGFLNVSRLESGKIHIDKQLFDMKDLVKEAEEEVLATIGSHHIVFEPVEVTLVMADRDKIGHVINNFISNAVKYSPVGSTINVACVTVGKNAQISVKDQGIGIRPADIDKLFERYYRVENVSTKSISGFGIGLYLCSEIIERHSGSIWVESIVGEGSTFHFSIPLDAAE